MLSYGGMGPGHMLVAVISLESTVSTIYNLLTGF